MHRLLSLVLSCYLMTSGSLVHALSIQVKDSELKPMPDTIVWYISNDQSKTHPNSENETIYIMDQQNKQFAPYVLAVPSGGKVAFPNSDSIKHHVYSFSAAKPFELKLYQGVSHQPLVFDKPGVVELGCNIHDWMLGYILVADSSVIGKTDAQGRISLELPDVTGTLYIWHPRFKQKSQPQQHIINQDKQVEVIISQPLLPDLGGFGNTDKLDEYD